MSCLVPVLVSDGMLHSCCARTRRRALEVLGSALQDKTLWRRVRVQHVLT